MPKAFQYGRANSYAQRSSGGSGGKVLFAWLTILIGMTLFIWVAYNRFFERQPEYSGNSPRGPFSAGVVVMVVGSRWLRRARQG